MYPILNGFRDRGMDVITHIEEQKDAFRRATCHVLTQVPKCIDVHGGIFENALH
jgi:hypothetical protein